MHPMVYPVTRPAQDAGFIEHSEYKCVVEKNTQPDLIGAQHVYVKHSNENKLPVI